FHALGYLLHCLRVHTYIESQVEQEERQMSMLFGLVQSVQQNEAGLNYKTRIRTPSLLGLG
ncbi:hypothetical protein, partial [Mesorhizobium sp. M00.F.Ca.ET.220.01.1.1]|uniref:hypothetical protein n=1 Tax=Mesorhizobium sp. M00.F.Ca.ET.220.01.1.1 TaxID=2500531 RepID=UPI001677E1BE